MCFTFLKEDTDYFVSGRFGIGSPNQTGLDKNIRHLPKPKPRIFLRV